VQREQWFELRQHDRGRRRGDRLPEQLEATGQVTHRQQVRIAVVD
jgi:hypothetical protein